MTADDVQEYMVKWTVFRRYWKQPWTFYISAEGPSQPSWDSWRDRELAAGRLEARDPGGYRLTEAWREEVAPLYMKLALLGELNGEEEGA